jgi:hypothetical protein
MKHKPHRIVYEEMKMVDRIKRELLLIVMYESKLHPGEFFPNTFVIKKYRKKPPKEQLKSDIEAVKGLIGCFHSILPLMINHFPNKIPAEQYHLEKDNK